ncbi:hypothetical protein [Enterococcus sp. N249-2]
MDKNDTLKWEHLFRTALGKSDRGEYYEIDSDFLTSSSRVFNAARATLTAHQYAGKLSKDEVYNHLSKFSELENEDSTNEVLLKQFYDETKKILNK